MKLVTRPNFFIVFILNTVFRREGDEGTKAIKNTKNWREKWRYNGQMEDAEGRRESIGNVTGAKSGPCFQFSSKL